MWSDILIKHNFRLLEETTRTYGNGKFTGSICKIDKGGNFKMDTTTFIKKDNNWAQLKEVFVPFQPIPEKDRVVLKTELELIEYLKK